MSGEGPLGQAQWQERLRAVAEAGPQPGFAETASLSADESRALVHELRTHQIELQLQNEELRRAQVELVASRDHFSHFYDLAPAGYLTLNANGEVTEANLTLAAMLGCGRDGLLGRRLAELVVRKDRDLCWLHRKAARESPQPARCQLRLERVGAEPLWVELTTTSLRTAGEDQPRLRVIICDISERRRAADELRESEQQFRTIIAASADAIFIADERGRYVYANDRAVALLGYSADELRKMTIADLSIPSEIFINVALYESIAATGRGFVELGLVHKDGARLQVDLNAVVLPDGRIYGSYRDLSGRKALEAKFAQADRLASMGTLAAGVAHKINNPLTYVLSNLETASEALARLREAVTEPIETEKITPLVDSIAEALEGVRRIRDVVKGLYAVTRVDDAQQIHTPMKDVIRTALQVPRSDTGHRAEIITDVGNLPASDSPSHAPSDSPATAPTPATPARRRVLIIDDEPKIGRLMQRILKKRYDATLVASGELAQELLAEDQAFDRIICDLMMPGMSGIDVHAWLAEQHPELANRMIFCTGGAYTTGNQAFLERTANPVLMKPFSAQALYELLEG